MEFMLISFFVVLLIYFFMRHKKRYSYWKDRNIKSLPVYPLVGSYVGFLTSKRHFGESMRNVYEQYANEKYVGAFQLSIPELILRDPEVIRSVMARDFNHFMDRGLRQHVSKDDVLGQHLFHLAGKKWRVLRQRITPTFTSTKMRKMFHLIVECAELLGDNIREELSGGNEIDVKELTAKFTTDTIGSCAFGLQMNSLKDEDSPFRKMGKQIFVASRLHNFLKFAAGSFPFLMNLFNLKFYSGQDEIQRFFLDLVESLIKTRTSANRRNDFIDLMLELRNKGTIEMKNDEADTLEITDELITAQLFVFFVAGFETSSSTMTFALRELALNPGVQKKLQEEIDTVLKKHGGNITYESVQEMEYLDMVIDETLRKYPPVAFLNRICTIPYTIPDTDIVLDKGVKILVPIYGIHNDPIHFPEPEKFKPERFSKDNGDTHHPFAYMPFGEGPRICIGLRFGKLQTATGLISFLRKYSVEACSKTKTNISIDPNAFLFCISGGITLRVEPRTLENP